MSIFSENMNRLKDEAGLSLNEMGRKIGVPASTVLRLINSNTKPRRTSVMLVSSRLGIDAYTLEYTRLSDNEAALKSAVDTLLKLSDPGSCAGPAPKNTPTLVRARKADLQIEPEDLFNHGLLVAKYAHARDLLKEDPDSFGFLSLVMPTDELMPTVPRGSIAYLSVEKNPRTPSASQDFAVGIDENRHIYTFGVLEIAQGKMFITPINPRFAGKSTEVTAVVARVEAWMVFAKQ